MYWRRVECCGVFLAVLVVGGAQNAEATQVGLKPRPTVRAAIFQGSVQVTRAAAIHALADTGETLTTIIVSPDSLHMFVRQSTHGFRRVGREVFTVMQLTSFAIWFEPLDEGRTRVYYEPAAAGIIAEIEGALGTAVRSQRYLQQGLTKNRAQEWDEAIPALDSAIEINPWSAAAYYERGAAYSWKQMHDEAIQDYSKALELNPKSSVSLVGRGNMYFSAGQYMLAIADYTQRIDSERGTNTQPVRQLASVFLDRGRAYYEADEYSLAIADFDKIIEYHPSWSPSYLYKAPALEGSGNLEEAALAYRKYLETVPPENSDADERRRIEEAIAVLIEPLIGELQSDRAQTRQNAAELLGDIGSEAATDPLTALLAAEPDRNVRRAARRALEKIQRRD